MKRMDSSNRWNVEMPRDKVVAVGYDSCGICNPQFDWRIFRKNNRDFRCRLDRIGFISEPVDVNFGCSPTCTAVARTTCPYSAERHESRKFVKASMLTNPSEKLERKRLVPLEGFWDDLNQPRLTG